MEYISMTQAEAWVKCEEFNYLVGKEYFNRENKRECVVIAVIVLPSQSEYLMKMCEFVIAAFKGIDSDKEMNSLLLQYNKDEFTIVAVSRLNPLPYEESLVPVGYSFLPVQYLANKNGELHLGFDF